MAESILAETTTCNQALGAMRDDPALLRAAIAYLERGSGGAGGSDG